jgi:hypothetical protein
MYQWQTGERLSIFQGKQEIGDRVLLAPRDNCWIRDRGSQSRHSLRIEARPVKTTLRWGCTWETQGRLAVTGKEGVSPWYRIALQPAGFGGEQ